ncbi:hypothetical protein PUN28_012483 [Cardiocondyla obscurior]|uniref:Ribosomal protein S14 n=1 Tax=Cardiocondyla obscurior TaxID=286306 RepID=A0AAW2FBN6_9HYME
MRSIDIQIIYSRDPSPRWTKKGKMVVIRREDDHRTSHGERDEFVGVRQTPGATTYYPLGGRNSPLKRLYSDNPTFPFLRLICPERRHFNTCSCRIIRHKYGRIYASRLCRKYARLTLNIESDLISRGFKCLSLFLMHMCNNARGNISYSFM